VVAVEVSLEIAAPLIKEFEGLRLKAYHDSAGWPTQGWGHKLEGEKWADLSLYPDITIETAEQWLAQDMRLALNTVLAYTAIQLAAHQVAALVSFVFNLGAGNFLSSTMLKKINQDKLDEVPAELRRWVYAGGKKERGLVRRREAEANLFTGV
jgi:lysozyme